MKTAKVLIFIIGIFLANYLGGVPTDAKNLFITQTIFFAPYLVDFYPLIKLKSFIKWIALIIWSAGIIMFAANILGIAEIITVHNQNVVFSKDYYSPLPFDLNVHTYLRWAGIVYASVFMGTLTLDYSIALNKHLLKKKKIREKDKVSGKELAENVSTR